MPFPTEHFKNHSIDFFIAILDHLTAPIFVKDESHRLVFINQAWCDAMGRKRGELLGKTDYDFHPKEEADVFWEKDTIVLETGEVNANIETVSWIDGIHTISTTKRRYIDPRTQQKFIMGIIIDISSEKIAKQNLLESQQNLDEVLRFSRDISYKIDLEDSSYKYISYSIEDLLGWPSQVFLDQGRSFSETIFHPDDIFQMESIISFIKQHPHDYPRSSELEFRLKHKNGTYRWFLDHFSVIEEQGKPRYMIGTIVDITERKQTEFDLLESEEKFRNLIDQAPFDIQIYDMKGVLRSVNSNFQKIWGIDPQEIIGHFNIFTDPTLKELGLIDGFKQAYRGELAQIPDYLFDPRKSGYNANPKWLRTNIFPIKNDHNQVLNVCLIHQDISEHKKSIHELEESEKKYNQLFYNSRDAIILHTIDGEITEANQSAQDLFGYSREEFLKFVTDDLHPTDQKILKRNLTQEFLEGSRSVHEIVMQRKDGSMFESNVSASPIKIGDETYIQAIIRDISEQKRKEAEQLRSQKIESIALLAGGIAHDFNNILVGILGNVNFMQLDANISDELTDSLIDIEKATLRATDLTKQLLTFSKGGAPLKKPQNIMEILYDSISFVMRGSKSKCLLESDSDLPYVDVDSGQMNQVFNNLLINANQAMVEGGFITIKLKIVNLLNSIEVPLPNGYYIQISVVDQGGGISPEIQQHIFEPYFTTKSKGNGLGLATCYSIIKRHGGYITFEVELSVGTTFIIYLPVSGKAIDAKAIKPELKQAYKGKIIIMDDDPMILKILSKILKKLGLSVDIAYDGAELLEKYTTSLKNQTKYDLVIMDLTIPGGIGGKETIAKLLEINPNVKAIVSSGYSNDPIIANYKKFGFSQVLNKPYTIEAIKNILSEFF